MRPLIRDLVSPSKAVYDLRVSRERIPLPRAVRSYFAEIGRRGGLASRRGLTRQQAKSMVAVREKKRAAKKKTKSRRKRRS